MCIQQRTGHRIGMCRWHWDEFVFGAFLGTATVRFTTNHRDDGSVPNDEVEVTLPEVDQITVCDDGNEIELTSEDRVQFEKMVLKQFEDEKDSVVDSFGWGG